MFRYNITVDHEDGTCNLIYGAMSPWITMDNLVYYTYDSTTDQFDQHIISMNDVVSISMTR